MKNHIYQKGELVFSQGDESHSMFEIQSGQIGIYANYKTPKEKQLAVFGEGETFGEMGMIENAPRSATAIALADQTEVQEINATEFSDYFEEKPIDPKGQDTDAATLYLLEAEDKLKMFFGTSVRIKGTGKKKKLEIDFSSNEELERIIGLISDKTRDMDNADKLAKLRAYSTKGKFSV